MDPNFGDNTSNLLAGLGFGFFLLVALVPLIIWVVTLVSIVKSPNWTPAFKALWALAALPTGLVGMICWFVWGTKEGNLLPTRQSLPPGFPPQV